MAYVLKCEVSDIRSRSKNALEYRINKINANDASLEEWQDLVCYLTRKAKTFNTCGEAKEYILEYIRNRL